MLYANLSGFNLIGFYRRFNSVLNRLTKLVIGKKVVCFIFFFISFFFTDYKTFCRTIIKKKRFGSKNKR